MKHKAANEWTSEGDLNEDLFYPLVDADGDPPVIHRARMMVREASGRQMASIWVVSQKQTLLSHRGTKAFFVSCPDRWHRLRLICRSNSKIWRKP